MFWDSPLPPKARQSKGSRLILSRPRLCLRPPSSTATLKLETDARVPESLKFQQSRRPWTSGFCDSCVLVFSLSSFLLCYSVLHFPLCRSRLLGCHELWHLCWNYLFWRWRVPRTTTSPAINIWTRAAGLLFKKVYKYLRVADMISVWARNGPWRAGRREGGRGRRCTSCYCCCCLHSPASRCQRRRVRDELDFMCVCVCARSVKFDIRCQRVRA